jgi:hypothetical protein
MEPILLGTTDRTILVFIPDGAQTDGSGKTGLSVASLTVSYTRVETDNDVVVTDVTGSLSDIALTDAHVDWGFEEVSSTLAPGLYRLDVADAVFAAGAWYAVVYVMITTSAASATPKAFLLVAYNPLDGVRLGLTGLANAVPGAAGGLFIAGTNAATTVTTALTTTFTGNLTGSVASVTGAVGSVTGAVGSVTALADNSVTAAALAADAGAEIADAVLNRDMATGTDSGSTTVRTARQALRAIRNKVSISAGTLTVTKEDDATASWTAAVTTTAGNPISAVDPAGP